MSSLAFANGLSTVSDSVFQLPKKELCNTASPCVVMSSASLEHPQVRHLKHLVTHRHLCSRATVREELRLVMKFMRALLRGSLQPREDWNGRATTLPLSMIVKKGADPTNSKWSLCPYFCLFNSFFLNHLVL